MKKLISLAIVLVMLFSLSISVFAAEGTPYVSLSNKEAKTGDTVTVTITMNSVPGISDGGYQGNVSVSGMTVTSVSGPYSSNGMAISLGETVTYTCTVTAGEGENYSFTLSGIKVTDAAATVESAAGSTSVSGTVPVVTPEPTPEVTPQPTPEVTPQPTPEVTPAPSAPNTPTVDSDLDDVPKTGDATVYVAAAIISVCAVIVAAVYAGKKIFVK